MIFLDYESFYMCMTTTPHSLPFLPPPHPHTHLPDPHMTALSAPGYVIPTYNMKEWDLLHIQEDPPG